MTLTCARRSCSFATEGQVGSAEEYRMFTTGTAGNKEHYCNPACYMYRRRVRPDESSIRKWTLRMKQLYPEVAASFFMPSGNNLGGDASDSDEEEHEEDGGTTGRWADE